MGSAVMAAGIHDQLQTLALGERFPFEYYAAMMVLMAILLAWVRKPKVLD